jgi:hypothetical protein
VHHQAIGHRANNTNQRKGTTAIQVQAYKSPDCFGQFGLQILPEHRLGCFHLQVSNDIGNHILSPYLFQHDDQGLFSLLSRLTEDFARTDGLALVAESAQSVLCLVIVPEVIV